MQDLTLSILGFPAVNRDLTVELRDPVTATVVREVKPFLDGTVRIPQIASGAYELAIKHPNLALPVLQRPIRVLPVGNTNVSVVIDPSKFRNTPIEDIPDANLGPVQDLVRSVADTVTPLGLKLPGEAILAQDWNSMAGAIRDLAGAVSEMTRLVSPQGHNHPELEKKLGEMTGNFDTLVNTVTASLTELQRQIQTQRIRKQVDDVLLAAEVGADTPKARELTDLVKNLELNATESPTRFGREVRNTAVQLSTKLEALLDDKKDDATFVSSEAVKSLSASIDLAKQQRSSTYDSELEHHRKVDRTLGAAAFRIQ
jgi:hypothetical protein